MWRGSSMFLMLLGSALSLPAQALAQTQQSPSSPWSYGFGPWLMWGGGWSSFWWICPLMMVAMMLAMMFVCRHMGSWRRD